MPLVLHSGLRARPRVLLVCDVGHRGQTAQTTVAVGIVAEGCMESIVPHMDALHPRLVELCFDAAVSIVVGEFTFAAFDEPF